MNVQIIEEAIHNYVAKYGVNITLWANGGHHAKALAQSIADRLKDSWQKDFAEAYQQGHFDGMQNAKEISNGNHRVISYSDDTFPKMTIEEEEEVVTTTKFDIY